MVHPLKETRFENLMLINSEINISNIRGILGENLHWLRLKSANYSAMTLEMASCLQPLLATSKLLSLTDAHLSTFLKQLASCEASG